MSRQKYQIPNSAFKPVFQRLSLKGEPIRAVSFRGKWQMHSICRKGLWECRMQKAECRVCPFRPVGHLPLKGTAFKLLPPQAVPEREGGPLAVEGSFQCTIKCRTQSAECRIVGSKAPNFIRLSQF